MGLPLSYSGQRKIAFDAGFDDGIFQRAKDNPYKKAVVGGSWQAYEDGFIDGQISTDPPRGPAGQTGASGPVGQSGVPGEDGTPGNRHFVANGSPAAGLGDDDDVYTDADNGAIWLKVTGSWVLQGPGNADVALAERVDFVDPDADPIVIYRGEALPGTTTAAASWRVREISVADLDSDATTLWADGNDNFDNIWDNRAALSYS